MTIDAGSADGVERNDAVVTDDGLDRERHRRSPAAPRWSTLITDPDIAVTAPRRRRGPEGLIVPVVGSPGELDFTLIQGDKEVEDGDELVTAGFSSDGDLGLDLSRPSIPIGEVSEAIPAEQEQRQQVTRRALRRPRRPRPGDRA